MFTKDKHSVVESAARWHARLSAPDCTDNERLLCASWRQQDPAHEEAFAAAEKLSRMMAQFGAADTRLRAMADRAFAAGTADLDARARSRRQWPRVVIPAALAAAAAVVTVTLGPMFGLELSPPKTSYYSASAQRGDVTLADGTLVHLDAQSSIKVRLGAHKRQVELVAGRAFFEVAHDASRPFTVAAGNERITALGTRFQVDRQDQFVVVTLDEGSISVVDADASARSDVLRPGQQIKVSTGDGSRSLREVDSQMATSWSHGRLVFRATPLAEALEEFNRYSSRKLRLGEAGLAALPVSGSFIPGDSSLTVSALTAVLPLKAVDAGQEIMLFRDGTGGAKPEAEAHAGNGNS